jgi:vancomycin permeability regulator SanA
VYSVEEEPLGTAGLTVLLASAVLLILLVDNYNDTRRINVPLASLTFTTYTLAQALLASAVASYTATRTYSEMPPIPEHALGCFLGCSKLS